MYKIIITYLCRKSVKLAVVSLSLLLYAIVHRSWSFTDWAMLSADLQFIYLDPVLESHLEEQAELLVGKSLLSFVHPDEQASAKQDLGGVLDSRTLHGSVTRYVPFTSFATCSSIHTLLFFFLSFFLLASGFLAYPTSVVSWVMKALRLLGPNLKKSLWTKTTWPLILS